VKFIEGVFFRNLWNAHQVLSSFLLGSSLPNTWPRDGNGQRIRRMNPIAGDNADTGRATKYHEAERRYGFHPLENERHSK
jgi:hypothetical protein